MLTGIYILTHIPLLVDRHEYIEIIYKNKLKYIHTLKNQHIIFKII